MTDRIATGTIAREIDGDTFVVDRLDPGWGVNLLPTHPSDQRCHIRLSGVNTPDSKSSAKWYDPALAKAASAYFATTWPVGTPVVLVSHGLDDFGRSLADVWVGGDPLSTTAVNIAAELVRQGYARLGDYPVAPAET
jgi:endonuclease YncB( thermonuclease family)